MSLAREPNAEPLPGYRLIEPLGTGGFGEVWKCEAPGGLYKAIKFVYGNLNSMDLDSARAEQEFQALNCVKEVRHPFVLSMDLIKVVEGQLLIVMELADKSVYDKFAECQAVGLIGIPRQQLLGYVRDAAEALDHMIEKHNLQHLDIKPRNLFLVSDRVKVADFGLVKHLERQSGTLASVTPLYAPPETFAGTISPHSDQYSLAIVYQEMLTGQRPFNGKNARQLALQHAKEDPDLRVLPEAERPVVARALAKDPAKRFPNCLAFVRALYMARAPIRPETIILEPDGSANGKRPKTMVETMEDIFLEAMDANGNGNGVAAAAEDSAHAVPDEVSQLGVTVQQPQSGALRPTLIIGLGTFGRHAIRELRCRFLDRFADLAKIPLLRFLYIDPDQESVRSATRGSADVACSNNEVYHLPLQPVGNYRRRILDQLSEWLPREKLYSLPRSLQTQGSRALGRLAFTDNHLRLMTRIRREIQQVTHPDALYEAVSQTGLALRDNRPRVYVIAAAGGGTSGLLVDLGYALQRVLRQLRYPEAEVTCLLFCGAPDDPATPRAEQANVYATLTELNHFTDSAIPFAAQYGAEGVRTIDNGQPFHSVYLLKVAHRGQEELRDAVAHLGSYLFHELMTPLGLRLDRARGMAFENGHTFFRSFGTYAVWFPRGLLLRLASSQACVRLLKEWQAADEPDAAAEVEAACARALADPDLRFESLCARIEETAAEAFEGNLAGSLTTLLSSLEDQAQQSVAQDDPGNWARQAWRRVRELIGSGSASEDEGEWRKSRLRQALTTATQKVAADWNQRLAEAAFGLMEHTGRRVAAAESALQRFMQFCQEGAAANREHLDRQAARTHQALQQVEKALQNCILGAGGFSFFGSRSRRLLRVFVDHLAAFSRQCLAEEIAAAGVQFFAVLQSQFDERVRDLSFVRQRLRHLQENLESPEDHDDTPGPGADRTMSHTPLPSAEAYWDAIRQSGTARLVLPDGESDLEVASRKFLAGLGQEQWTHLDQSLQDRVLSALGGLHHVCLTGGNLSRHLAGPLLANAASFLGDLLPVTDVAQVEFSAADAQKADLAAQIKEYFESAAPLIASAADANQQGFLLVPAGDAGKAFGEEAERAVKDLELVRVPGQADLMFCREQGYLSADDLQRLLRSCRKAYDEAAGGPTSSPHARFDITDWVPLDP